MSAKRKITLDDVAKAAEALDKIDRFKKLIERFVLDEIRTEHDCIALARFGTKVALNAALNARGGDMAEARDLVVDLINETVPELQAEWEAFKKKNP